MDWLISQNQVVGIFDPNAMQSDKLPSGFSIVEGADGLIDAVYYDPGSSSVKLKPDQPSDRHYWDPNLREWVELQSVDTTGPRWEGLLSTLRGSPLWAKVFTASKANLDCNSSFTVLYGTLSSDRNIDTLEWAIGAMRASMVAASIGDFTADEIAEINTMLSSNRFPFQIS